MEEALSKKWGLLSHIFWSLKLSFRYLPIISTLRLIGYIINQTYSLVSALAIGLVIDWVLEVQNQNDINYWYTGIR